MADSSRPPPCFAGFEHINRYWDNSHNTWSAKILPGQYYVTAEKNEIVATTLGSCVSACIRDKQLGIGGMNHFMLPKIFQHNSRRLVHASAHYGSFAMQHLINEILKNGGTRANLEVKITGGGKMMELTSDIGSSNIAFALEFLQTEQISIISKDVGGIYPRKVMYYPSSGRLRVKRLRSLQNDTLILREQAYMSELETQQNIADSKVLSRSLGKNKG
jgi:chemotaxis protein CheD